MKKLNFGCGTDIKEGWDNVDIQKDKSLTKSFDFDKFPYPIKDNSYDYVYTRNVLEHLKSPDQSLNELWRVCKSNAIIEISVPYYNNKGAYSDMQHKHYFSDSTFICFVNEEKKINKKRKFEIIEIKLIPTNVGKLFPKIIRNKIAIFIGGMIAQVEVRLKVKK